MNQPKRFAFFAPTGSYLYVRRDGNTVIVEQGDLTPWKITSFKYGAERTPLEQAAQRVINEKDPLIIDEKGDNFQLIDDDDR